MGQIVFNGQKPKYCNLTAITTGSKKDYVIPAGEVWLIDSTNTSKTDGTGKYDYYIKGDGSKTASQLAENKIKIDDLDEIIIDSVPTSGSDNAVSSGGVYQAIQSIDVSSQISGKADRSEMSVVAGTGADADKTTITLKSGTSATVLTQHQDISDVARSGSYNDLADKPNIPSAVTESTVSGWGFTKNTGTYSKPNEGIPSTDLDSSVQTSLGKADSAIQSVTVGTTTTGAPGTNASVTNTGTATAPVLSFTIPQGAQGIQGIQGIQGVQGERGPVGANGVTTDATIAIITGIDTTTQYDSTKDVASAEAVQDVLKMLGRVYYVATI